MSAAEREHEVHPAEGDLLALETTCQACGVRALWRLGTGKWEHAPRH
jgi:hypothetical protein